MDNATIATIAAGDSSSELVPFHNSTDHHESRHYYHHLCLLPSFVIERRLSDSPYGKLRGEACCCDHVGWTHQSSGPVAMRTTTLALLLGWAIDRRGMSMLVRETGTTTALFATTTIIEIRFTEIRSDARSTVPFNKFGPSMLGFSGSCSVMKVNQHTASTIISHQRPWIHMKILWKLGCSQHMCLSASMHAASLLSGRTKFHSAVARVYLAKIFY